jgi:hypothetical protein
MSDILHGFPPSPPPENAPAGTDPPAPPQYPQFAPPPTKKGSGLAVAALVLGIIALVFCWIPFLNVLSIILGLVGLGLGVPALIGALRGSRTGKGMAVAGVVLAVVSIIASIAISAAATKAVDDAISGTKVSTSDGAASDGGSADDKAATKGVFHFGETVTYKDGSTLKVEAPVAFKPGKYSAGGEKFAAHVKYRATFTNNTKKVFDPAMSDANVTSAGVEGESVYQNGLDAPDNPVLPGKSVTWWMGYGVNDSADTQLTVRLGFLDYDDAIFTP